MLRQTGHFLCRANSRGFSQLLDSCFAAWWLMYLRTSSIRSLPIRNSALVNVQALLPEADCSTNQVLAIQHYRHALKYKYIPMTCTLPADVTEQPSNAKQIYKAVLCAIWLGW